MLCVSCFLYPLAIFDLASIDPKVFEEYREFVDKYGDLSGLPTRHFIGKPTVGEEMNSQSTAIVPIMF